MDRSFVLEVTEHYTGGRSGVERAEGLVSAAKAMVSQLEDPKSRVRPEDFHIGQMFESFCNFPGSKLFEKAGPLAANRSPADVTDQDIVEAITASQFPFITGKLIHRTLIPEYKENLGPVERLVTEDESDRKTVDVAGTMGAEEPELILDGEEYQLSGDREKSIQIKTQKFGRRIALTREAITFDKTGGQLLRRARNVGKEMGRHRATWIVEGAQDIAIAATGQSANTMFKYDGSTSAVYANSHSGVDGQTNDNLITNALGTIGLQAARKTLRSMKNYYGKILRLEGRQLLVPESLFVEANKLVASLGDPDSANTGDVNVFRGKLTDVISDPLLDVTSTTAWYYGDFPSNLLWLWIWRPAVQDIPGDARRDIMVEFKYGYYAGLGNQDYRNVVKSDGSGS